MRRVPLGAVALACGLAAGSAALAQERIDPVPRELERAGVEERLDASLPLQLAFKDDQGRDVTLGRYFKPGRPVILTLNYYRCPMLCTLELNGLVAGLRGLGWTPGDEFEIVTVSIDPKETSALARAKKLSYLEDYGKPAAEAGWHFLTGGAAAIEALTGTVGFSYQYDAETDQYAHPAVIVLASPEGRITRYLYGVEFPSTTLRMGLLEASKGKIGTAIDRFVLYCYHFDAERGRYSIAAVKIMRVGGLATLLGLGIVVSRLRRRGTVPGRAA